VKNSGQNNRPTPLLPLSVVAAPATHLELLWGAIWDLYMRENGVYLIKEERT